MAAITPEWVAAVSPSHTPVPSRGGEPALGEDAEPHVAEHLGPLLVLFGRHGATRRISKLLGATYPARRRQCADLLIACKSSRWLALHGMTRTIHSVVY